MPAKKGVPNPNAGRKAGVPNKSTENIKELTRRHAGLCVEQLINIVKKSKIESNRLSAINQILDRGFGKPTQAVVGDSEQPVELRITWLPTQKE